MKHKFSFPGILLPAWKHCNASDAYFYYVVQKGVMYQKRTIACFCLACLLVFSILPFPSKAQLISPVKQGEKVPAVVLDNLTNYPISRVNVTDIRGKLLILDFWESWCKGCLVLMPKVKSLQKTYADQIQILAVSAQSAEAIARVAKVNELVRQNPIPMITSDRKLAAMFPHKLVPHIVWISPDGTYLGATDQSELTGANIDQILATGNASFDEYKNDLLNFDPDKPLFTDSAGIGSKFLFKSAITPYQPGVPGQSGLDNMGEQLRMYGINTDLFRLYCLSLHVATDSFPPNRIVYADTALRRKFRYDPKLRNRESLYCYELIVPTGKKETLRPLMRSELVQAIGININVHNQEVACYVLRLRNKAHPVGAVTGKVGFDVQMLKWTNELVDYLNNLPDMPPVIDETGGDKKLNAVIDLNGLSLSAMNEKLRPFNLVLAPERRRLGMLVVDTLRALSPQLTE